MSVQSLGNQLPRQLVALSPFLEPVARRMALFAAAAEGADLVLYAAAGSNPTPANVVTFTFPSSSNFTRFSVVAHATSDVKYLAAYANAVSTTQAAGIMASSFNADTNRLYDIIVPNGEPAVVAVSAPDRENEVATPLTRLDLVCVSTAPASDVCVAQVSAF